VLHCVDEGVWLGSATAASDGALLLQHGIQVVLNVAADLHVPPVPSLRYHHVHLEDSENEDLTAHLPRCFEVLSAARAAGESVLVHCVMVRWG
jgi:protein-tyrosine phosphatase